MRVGARLEVWLRIYDCERCQGQNRDEAARIANLWHGAGWERYLWWFENRDPSHFSIGRCPVNRGTNGDCLQSPPKKDSWGCLSGG